MVSIEPGSRQSQQIGCYVIFAAGMIVGILRLYARQFLVRKLGADDYLIAFAMLTSIGLIVTVPSMYELGIGRRTKDLTQYEILQGRKWAWVSQVLYYLALGFIKTSMVALYLRLAFDFRHRLILYIFGAIVFAHGIITFIITIFLCKPISIMWSPSFPQGCMDILAFNYFNAGFHILTDILLALIPIPMLKRLQINRRQKIGLGIAFGVGILTVCTTIARQVTNAIALTHPENYSWHWSAAELCTVLEVNMGIICASVPGMRSFFKVHFSGSSGDRGDRSYELNQKTPCGSKAWRSVGSSQSGFNEFESAKKQTRTNIFGVTARASSESNESQKDIIPPPHNYGVLQTTNFEISYSSPPQHDVDSIHTISGK